MKVTLALLTADEALAEDYLHRQRDAHLARRSWCGRAAAGLLFLRAATDPTELRAVA